MDAYSFLEQVSAYTENQIGRARPRLGFIDWSYDPETFPNENPRIVFDGEGMSDRTYPCMWNYEPVPGDRVILLPIGTGFVVLGCVDRTDRMTLNPGQLVFKGVQTSVQNLSTTPTGIDLQDIELDVLGGHSVSSPSRYRPSIPGWYRLSGGMSVEPSTIANNQYVNTAWMKNGSIVSGGETRFSRNSTGQAPVFAARSMSVFLDGDSDYIQLGAYAGASATTRADSGLPGYYSHVEAVFVGVASSLASRSIE